MSERGRVIWFCGKRGYGFIDSGHDDVFVHFTAIEGNGYRELHRNQMVEFERGIGANGTLQAMRVRAMRPVNRFVAPSIDIPAV